MVLSFVFNRRSSAEDRRIIILENITPSGKMCDKRPTIIFLNLHYYFRPPMQMWQVRTEKCSPIWWLWTSAAIFVRQNMAANFPPLFFITTLFHRGQSLFNFRQKNINFLHLFSTDHLRFYRHHESHFFLFIFFITILFPGNSSFKAIFV